MLRKPAFWLKAAIVFQLLTAVIHAMTLFLTPAPANETERQLILLMDTYQQDFGAGFSRTMSELVTALSACFTLVCLLGGLINWHLIRKKVDMDLLKGIVNINIIVFGICFILMVVFTFLPPIICTGLILTSLLFCRVSFSKE